MFVLIIEDATTLPGLNLLHDTPGAYPASMVWADPEELENEAAVEAVGRGTRTRQAGVRVFGPFETYAQGELAALTLAPDADYWVIPVDPVAT